MKLENNLNLVFPIRMDEQDNAVLYAYHTPISKAVFESSFRIIAATKAVLFSKGHVFAADVGPRIASLTLKDEAKKDAEARGQFDAEGNPDESGARALLAEIRRLTMILCPTGKGWEMTPVDAALSSQIIDAEEWEEAESALVFFTCPYALANRSNRPVISSVVASVLGGSTTSLGLTEYRDSLQKSIAAQGSMKAELSVPS